MHTLNNNKKMQAEIEIVPLDWNPQKELGRQWRSAGANLREKVAVGQVRSVDLSWDINTGFIIAQVGKRNCMGLINSGRFYAISSQQIAALFLEFDKRFNLIP